MANIVDVFKIMITIQLFYAFSITGLAYTIPSDAHTHINPFIFVSTDINMENIAREVQDNLQQQKDMPIIEMGALVFYSGNFLIDLLANFMFAIPEMIGLLVNAILMILSIDSYIFAYVQIFSTALIVVMYVIMLIQLLTGIRSGRIT